MPQNTAFSPPPKSNLTALRERKWGVQDVKQDNYIDAFECMVCTKVWDNIRLQEKVSRSRFGREVLGWPS